MSYKRTGQLTVSGEWAKHLRRYNKRQFWRGERKAGQRFIDEALLEGSVENMVGCSGNNWQADGCYHVLPHFEEDES